MKNSAKGVLAVALKVLMAVGIALLLCGSANTQGAGNAQGPANAQGLVTQRNLSLAMAKTVAEAALAACQAKGYHTAVAVVDRAGQVLVILRDEQATSQMAEMARRKAYTARMYRMTTAEFQKRTAEPNYAAQRDLAAEGFHPDAIRIEKLADLREVAAEIALRRQGRRQGRQIGCCGTHGALPSFYMNGRLALSPVDC